MSDNVSYAQADGDILYNVKRVEVEEIDTLTGDVKKGSKTFVIECDSEIGLEPEINEGEKKVLRDATKILAQAKEEDLLEGMGLKLSTVKFPAEVIPMIQGGTLRYDSSEPKKIVGYDAPTMAEGVKNKKYFRLKAYVENYEGDDVANYVVFTFWKCKGKPVKIDLKKDFFAPEFEIRATENTKIKKSVYSFDYVKTLPSDTGAAVSKGEE
ncbi:hypothetical protein HAHI6034_10875 [Hathewaya histolytica]|uniref:Phage major tail protein, phi13 family n=1 Tax=Hathewaya histolytica TaxID=1498 RepID=A0A4U9RCW1_HATHI|nr:hypothetical protein [Hathewaya histolytica]VTQ88761.1 Uncharacterised protein [Hathewaya histolytica]